jgi:HTH-type transcriptional regulator / antitoxin HigA
METDMSEVPKPFYNVGPGEVVQDALDALGWTQDDLADVTGLATKTVNQIIKNKQSITVETAQLFAKVFQTSPEMWLHLNDAFQLRKHEESPRELYAEYKGQLRRYMPLAEMRKKGWFFHDDSVKGLHKDCARIFGTDVLTEEEMDARGRYCARRSKSDEQFTTWYSATWFQVARLHALSMELEPFDRDAFRELCTHIPEYTLDESGLEHFIDACLACGVGLFVLSHLQKTYLDGAAFMVNEHPFMVYTARYDRIDNFWYTISHEAAHVLLHVQEDGAPVLDNLDGHSDSVQEQEADALAAVWLNIDLVTELGRKYDRYLSSERLAEISGSSGLSIPVVLGILQHAKIIDWRRFTPYRQPVLGMIPAVYIKG